MAKGRSAKQKAATRKLVALNKRRAKPKRRSSKPRKVNKRKSPTKRMAKRRSAQKSRSFASKIPLVNNPTIKKAATGIGLATIGVAAISLVAPQLAQNAIVRPALAFLGGGIPGVIGQVIVQGGIGGISNILGGNGGNQQLSFTPGFG